ncbi:hypothetical protein Dsin_011469 [Dipteronia sinensis]|uniref:DUF4283 domain-containing protein n=1 Tax=Dipteronia sinensis TaxID=43782 RepID=A0AAE0AVQ6_9ROSI|nr:hypothetical protein Dsin_011469 [Dipteronia sinensis]
MVNNEAFIGLLGKIWKVVEGVEIEFVSNNIFTFHFRNVDDRIRVLNGGPWTFDRALIVLEETSRSMVGMVKELDVGCFGEFLRVKVRLEVVKPFWRCSQVDVMEDGVEIVMILWYERLADHCFQCGRSKHSTWECSGALAICAVNGNEELPFEAWLRATVSNNKRGSHHRRFGRVSDSTMVSYGGARRLP